MKIRLVALIFSVVFASLVFNSEAKAEWEDYKPSSAIFKEIVYLEERGLLLYGADIYDALFELPAERRDAISMIAFSLNLDKTSRNTVFSDIPKESSESGLIQSAFEKGIVTGYKDGTFRPNDPVTRGQFAAFIDRAYGNYLPNNSNIEFKDVPKTLSSHDAIKKLAGAGIATGYKDGTFKPDGTLTKEDLAMFMYRTVKYLEDRGVVFKEASNNELQVDETKEVEIKKVETKIESPRQLESYLKENYPELKTDLVTVEFDYTVFENDDIRFDYDYKIEYNLTLSPYESNFESAMDKHLRSIKYQGTAKEDVAKATKQFYDFIETMAKDVIEKLPNKKILGRYYKSWYTYPNIRKDWHYLTKYNWTNYEPISMNHVWVDQPEDYYTVTSRLSPSYDPTSPSPLATQYRNEENERSSFKSEYSQLKYNDFKITNFGWRKYLDGSN